MPDVFNKQGNLLKDTRTLSGFGWKWSWDAFDIIALPLVGGSWRALFRVTGQANILSIFCGTFNLTDRI